MNPIKIGWAKEEYGLNEPVAINGQMYLRVSEGILDPVCCTALCVENGEIAIFCSIDVEGFYNGIMDLIIKRARELNPEIPYESVIFNATHTHDGMATGSWTPTEMPDGRPVYPAEKARARLIDVASRVIVKAYESRKPGGMSYGYGYAVVGHSRRTMYFEDMSAKKPWDIAPNGHVIMYGKTDKPEFSGFEAGADHFLNAMFTFDDKDKLTGIVVNVPCPSQVSEKLSMLSADYWNEVRENVAKTFGPDVLVLPQCAAAGDLSPRILTYGEAQERRMRLKYGMGYDRTKLNDLKEDYMNRVMAERKDIAERILEALKDVYSWAKKDIKKEVPVHHIFRNITIHKRTVTDQEAELCKAKIVAMEETRPKRGELPDDVYSRKVSALNSYIGRYKRAIERHDTEEKEQMMETPVHTVMVGDIAFATNRFEMYMDFMHRIQARSPFIQTFVVQLAGGEGGSYLPTERGVENVGYSASIFDNQASPKGGQELVEETLQMLNEMKEKDA